MPLPYLTADVPGIPGRLRVALDDFLVDEEPAYELSGAGEHLYVHFEKRDLTTPEAMRRLIRALGADPRSAGYAGLKDRRAVTRQWASFALKDDTAARALGDTIEGLRVLEVTRHANKLRTGHLRGNRFELRLREVPLGRENEVAAVLERLSKEGIPNFYGEQRFGREAQNVAEARRWIVGGERAPRDAFRRKLLVSSLQSELFNEVLAARLGDGLFARAVDGDLLRKEDSGGLFTTEDLADASARVASFEVSPTGPMFGAKMRWPERAARAREERALAAAGLDESHLAGFVRDGEGTRRPLRVRPLEVSVETEAPGVVRLRFTLPKGAYATVVLREVTKDALSPEETPDSSDEPSSSVPVLEEV
jgi:tRNA pseudouridine13 synthase